MLSTRSGSIINRRKGTVNASSKNIFLSCFRMCLGVFLMCVAVLVVSVVLLFASHFNDTSNESLMSLAKLSTIQSTVESTNEWNLNENVTVTNESPTKNDANSFANSMLESDNESKTSITYKQLPSVIDPNLSKISLLRTSEGNQQESNKITIDPQSGDNRYLTNNDSLQQVSNKANDRNEAVESKIKESAKDSSTLHIVFSTGCSLFQDWQSYAFFFHAWKSGQTGNVTRLVSGCDNTKQQKLERIFEEQILSSIPTARERFSIHFTPDYRRIHFDAGYENNPQPYNFFNKPWALRHWMENKLGFSRDENNKVTIPQAMKNSIIIVLDPDQIIMKPFKDDYTNDPTVMWHGYAQRWFLPKQHGYKIRKGLPFSQVYAFWNYWVSNVVSNITEVIRAAKWPDDSFDHGLNTWTEEDVNNYYVAGPPYMAVSTDMYDIVTVWSNIVIPVYYLTKKDHLAEMFAYSTAAAFLKLPHVLAYSFMVSNPVVEKLEGWYDQKYNSPNIINDTYFVEWSNPSYQKTPHQDAIPNVMHFCQEYMLGPYYFYKYYLPENMLTCSHPMLLEPPSLLRRDPTDNQRLISTNASRADCGTIALLYKSTIKFDGSNTVKKYHSKLVIKRHAYSLCQLIYRLNDAIEFWKKTTCLQENENVNYEKTFVFPHNQEAAIQIEKAETES